MASKREYVGALWVGTPAETPAPDGTGRIELVPGETVVEHVPESEATASDNWKPQYAAAKGDS